MGTRGRILFKFGQIIHIRLVSSNRQAGLHLRQAKILCFAVIPFRTMNTESGFTAVDVPTEGVVVFQCTS